ncbi:DUF1990 family protein [Leifsonia sp. SIMBA_070]|uniref:DUF1990 family protein n=1 Tax=Leifsonia sp. SIMBA_070 TaxID=3085810 RepID=UPI00397D228E
MTDPATAAWAATDPAYRRSEVSAVIGHGPPTWERATRELLRWGVKTASGFSVGTEAPVEPGQRVTIKATVLGVRIVEPVEVVEVVTTSNRVGFSYRTLPGHPVDGEEAFILHRRDNEIRLTVRSLTRRAPQQPWRALFPLLLLAQRVARRRYLRALR